MNRRVLLRGGLRALPLLVLAPIFGEAKETDDDRAERLLRATGRLAVSVALKTDVRVSQMLARAKVGVLR